MESKDYIVRVEGFPYTYGIGEVVAPNCAYFAAGNYGLTKDQLNAKLKSLGKVTIR